MSMIDEEYERLQSLKVDFIGGHLFITQGSFPVKRQHQTAKGKSRE